MIIQLVDRNQDMCDAWTTEFMDSDDVIIYCDDFFAPKTDCIVSPANSFGFMDGGLDGIITRRIGPQTQINVQEAISKRPMKELLVGETILVETGNEGVPYCISAPTMRVPMILKNTPNVYLASKAIFNQLLDIKNDGPVIERVTISGLGTGVGKVPFEVCAHQMKMAYDEVWLGKSKAHSSWYDAQKKHQLLFTNKNLRDLQHPE
jgi:O-acetyl-ADP-ribose deacetylase (regulator of RNase III)|tara:strand:- start:481 stop:1098 length:618 start_codon:yes stop_codon:yes gene_type:complete